MSLEGELGNLKIGTLIELYTHTDESVAGYVVDLSGKKAILSQNNPYQKIDAPPRLESRGLIGALFLDAQEATTP